ncbi:MAG: DUF4422 domain-containing protein [Anaeroplasmataceae bacterium]|nr:DUF4422 domain-containing protein [Anaeroplasmataceae bacterium]
MNEDIKLYVVTHKESQYLPKDRTFIGVGNNKDISNVHIYDNQGENIADKNSSFCELTALYWMWKNDSSTIVGLEHYRRFFCTKHCIFKPRPIQLKKIKAILSKYDCIVSQNYIFREGIYTYYSKNHIIEDLDLCREVIEEKTPEYLPSFDEVIHGKKAVMCNMFIMSKSLLNDYCDWLFSILFEVEKKISISERDNYQKRVYGFLSERLFNVWLYNKKLKMYHLPIYMPDEKPWLIKIKNLIKKLIRR